MLDWLDISFFNGFVLFVCIWWVAIFCVLPFGVTRNRDNPVGHEPGAPDRAMSKKKAVVATAITFAGWWLAVFMIYHPVSPIGIAQ
ncbi:MAG: hypothetical protein Alpg2KO_28890 [Alphaproteobacteria bacterium]